MNKWINAKSLTITADVITRNEVASLNSAVCVQKGQIRMSRFIIRMFLQHGLPHVEHVTFPSPVVSFTIISVSAVYSPLSAPFSQTAIPELLGTCKPGRKYRNIDRIYLHIAIAIMTQPCNFQYTRGLTFTATGYIHVFDWGGTTSKAKAVRNPR